MFRNRRRTIQSRMNTVSERIGRAHGGGRATVRDGSPRVMSPRTGAHMTSVDGVDHVLCVRTVVRSDDGRGFWSLFGEDSWRESKRVEISAFSYVYNDKRK